MTTSLKQAKELCTDAEFELVTASQKKNRTTQSAALLKQNITRAREMRDKWRDQARRQRRGTQQQAQARTTSANARSDEKAELFDEVLQRFETQLREVESAPSIEGKKKPAPKTPKPDRAREHRETRASTRDDLKAEKRRLNTRAARAEQAATPSPESAESAPSRAAGTKKKATAKKSAAAPGKAAKKAAKATAATRSARKKTVARKKAAVKQAAASNLESAPDKGKKPPTANVAQDQLSPPSKRQTAKTEAKRTAIDRSGLTSRVRGHVSGRGKRAQGRRDSR